MEFQGRTLGALESLTQNHILWGPEAWAGGKVKGPSNPEGFLNRSLAQLTARLEDLENQLANKK